MGTICLQRRDATHLVMSPLKFMQFHRALAPNAKLRAR